MVVVTNIHLEVGGDITCLTVDGWLCSVLLNNL